MAIGVPASQAAPFDCTTGTIFLSQGAGPPTGGIQLNALEYGAGSTQFRPIGPPYTPSTYNALGFNPDDNFLYAIDIDPPGGGPKSLLRIHDDGSAETFPLPGLEQLAQYHSGAFDDAGNYYVAQNGDPNNGLFQIDVATQAVTRIQLSETLAVSDFTFADGFLWGIATEAGGALRRINPTTGQIDSFPQTAVPGPYTDPSTGFGQYGANWTFGNGNLGFSNNETGQVTQVELSNPGGTPTLQRVSLASGPSSALNDGAMCPGLPTDLEVEKTGPAQVEPGGEVTWTITVTNNGPGGSSGFTVDDTIPAEVTNPQTSTPGCTISGGSLQCVLGILANGDSTDITITATMPPTNSTCVTNTASVIGNEEDPVDDNNSDDAETCTPDPTPWACDASGYLFQAPNATNPPYEVRQLDLVSGDDSLLVETPEATNGVGYNVLDNFIYGTQHENFVPGVGWTSMQIVRVSSGGGVEELGLPAAMNSPAGWAIGDVDANGHLWAATGSAGASIGWVEVDLMTPTPTVVSQGTLPKLPTMSAAPSDWAWVNGALYGVAPATTGEARLVSFTPGATAWTDHGPVAGVASSIYGAQFVDAAGYLYVSRNSDGFIYRVDPATGDAILVTDEGPISAGNDGARCAAAPIPTITVTKRVLGRVQSADQFTVAVVKPDGTTADSATTSGAGTTASTVDFPVSQGQTYTITDAMAGGSASSLAEYAKSIACTDGAGNPVATGGTETNWTLTVANPTDYTCTVTNGPPPPPPADVTIDKTVSAPRVRLGEMVTYRMVAKNNGPGVATDVKVSDNVPRRLDARSARSTQGSCAVKGNRINCALGTMAVGQTVRITVRARAIRSGRATNTARVDSPQCTTHPCDKDPARVRIVKAKLKLTKKVGKRVLRAGQTTSYRIRVRNPSDVGMRKVRTCDQLPAGLVYVKAKPKAKVSKGKHCWTIKRLGPGKGKTYKVTVRALRGTSGRKVNRATATSPDAKKARAKGVVRVIAGGLKPTAVTG